MCAVTANPAIIMSHTIVAAAARRCALDALGQEHEKRRSRGADPDPDQRERDYGQCDSSHGCVPIHAVATAAPTPPRASTAMPPMIHGVRRPPTSEP